MNIAICDDEENIRIYIRKLIQKQEPFCKITEFSSGKELLEFQDETNAEEIDILFLLKKRMSKSGNFLIVLSVGVIKEIKSMIYDEWVFHDVEHIYLQLIKK